MTVSNALQSNTDKSFGILVDVTRCTGCERCVDACVEANDLDPVKAARDRATTGDGLSANRLCTIVSLGENRYARKSCMHCEDPSCVAACLVGGITKSAEGPVVYDPDKCIGCRYCMLACPYHIPRYEWDQKLPFMKKCSMCFGKVSQGGEPACVSACPQKAITFGQRDELLTEAKKRIESDQGRYLPQIWGQDEWGGTSVLYISDTDLSAIGFDKAAAHTIPSVTDPIIHRTPHIGFGVAATITGLSWVLERRNRLMNNPAETSGEKNSGEHHD